jgi:hypothetical protein
MIPFADLEQVEDRPKEREQVCTRRTTASEEAKLPSSILGLGGGFHAMCLASDVGPVARHGGARTG